MGAPQYEQAGADIGGTGTTNTIPRWTGPSTLGNSVITQSGNNIGVGEPSPSGRLQVQGLSGNNTITAIGSTTTGQSYGIFVQAGTNASDRSFGVYNTSLSPYLFVRGDGNVGIGTASPQAALHVVNNIVSGVGATTTPYQHGLFGSSSAYTMWWRTNATAGGGLVGSAGPGLQFYTASGSSTSPTVSLAATIDSNGNIYGTSGTTGMTNGFFYIPAAAGAPTGVPTAVAGRVPMYYDTTNNQFYVYNGGWKKVTLA